MSQPHDYVDVITPTYNDEAHLATAIESVLQQTYPYIKLYVIDDGSKDKAFVKKLVERLADDRVTYIRQANKGVSAARNTGINASNSPYVAFLDADDYWAPEKISEQLSYLRAGDFGLVYGYCDVVDEEGKFIRSIEEGREGNLYNYLFLGNKITGSASMALVARKVLNEVGHFKEAFSIGEDWDLWLRIARKYTIGCVPKKLATIRDVSGSSQKNDLKVASQLEALTLVVLEEQEPKGLNKIRFMSFCLWEATMRYYSAGDIPAAKRTYLRSLIYNPFYLFNFNPGTWFACLRIIISNEPLRKVRRKLSSKYRQREFEGSQDK